MKQKGFTLMELITVIILTAILAAVALPKFIDLSDEARAAAVAGLASEITAQGKINYAASVMSGVFSFGSSTPATSTKVTTITNSAAAGATVALGACAQLINGSFSNLGTFTVSSALGTATGSLPGGISIASDQVCAAGGLSKGTAASCNVVNTQNTNISATAYVICTQ